MIYLFVLGDSLTSSRFITRTEELTQCYEPLQKLTVGLWPFGTGLNPASNFILLIVPRRYLLGGSFVLCLGV